MKPYGLKMKEVTAATNLPKSTILHYVAQGLLPEPTRTSRNMAYYDPTCVERAKFIKTIQDKYAFPLEKIKKLLQAWEAGHDITHLLELDAVIFGASQQPEMDEKAFRRATGLTARQVNELLAAGLLIPLKRGRYRQDDVEAGKAFAASFSQGLQAADLAFYVRIAKEVVDQEMRLRQRLTAALPENEDARLTTALTLGARLLRNYIIDRVFQRRVAAAQNLKDEALLS